MPPVDDKGHVDIENVPLFQWSGTGNAVADHMVDRGADRLWKAAIIQRRGDRVMRHGEIVHKIVEHIGGDPWLDDVHQGIERLGYKPASLGHAGKSLRAMQLDLGIAALRAAEFEV